MIVRDEAHNIASILADAQGFSDEIVVVDTGSQDNTLELVQRVCPSARVFHFEWCDDFSAARNYAIDQATCDTIMTLDADDRVGFDDQDRVLEFKEEKTPDLNHIWYCKIQSFFGSNSGVYNEFPQLRIFPNRPDIRYEGRIHNQLKYPKANYKIKSAVGIYIVHRGYEDPIVVAQKHERTKTILNKEFKERPNSGRVNIFLGLHHLNDGKPEEALPFIEKSLACYEPRADEKPWGLYQAYAAAIQAYHELGNTLKAYNVWDRFREFCSFNPDLVKDVTTIAEAYGFYDDPVFPWRKLLQERGIEL
jgi:glycosyltransferase involved in cell wall biosynthesis